VHEIDALWAMKMAGPAGRKPIRFHDIVMPNNTSAGVILGALSFVFAFAIIWHIWWLAVLSGLAMWAPLLAQTFDDRPGHRIPAREIKRLENLRGPLRVVEPGRLA
jgi:cytochrome o ubiquinol oxidase subunit I